MIKREEPTPFNAMVGEAGLYETVKGVSLKTKTFIFAILCMFKQCIIERILGFQSW